MLFRFRHGPNSVTVASSDSKLRRCNMLRVRRVKSEAASEKCFAARRGVGPHHSSHTLSRAVPPGSAAPRNSTTDPEVAAHKIPIAHASRTRETAGGRNRGKPRPTLPETATTRHLVPPPSPLLLTFLSGSYWLSTAHPARSSRPEPAPRWWSWRWEGAAAEEEGGGRGRSWCWAAPCSATGAPRGPPSPTSSGPAPRAPSRPRSAPRTLSNPSSCVQLASD